MFFGRFLQSIAHGGDAALSLIMPSTLIREVMVFRFSHSGLAAPIQIRERMQLSFRFMASIQISWAYMILSLPRGRFGCATRCRAGKSGLKPKVFSFRFLAAEVTALGASGLSMGLTSSAKASIAMLRGRL